MIDNVTDEKRALKLKQMRVRQHNKRCPNPGIPTDLGTRGDKMNGSYVSGDTKRHLCGAQNSMRELIKEQFKLEIAK